LIQSSSLTKGYGMRRKGRRAMVKQCQDKTIKLCQPESSIDEEVPPEQPKQPVMNGEDR